MARVVFFNIQHPLTSPQASRSFAVPTGQPFSTSTYVRFQNVASVYGIANLNFLLRSNIEYNVPAPMFPRRVFINMSRRGIECTVDSLGNTMRL